MNIDSLKAFLIELTQGTRAIIRHYWDEDGMGLEFKEDGTPVTKADRESEAHLREKILARFPDHGIIGEEFPNVNENAEYVWVLDPVDGTKSFISHIPLFGTLIGLLHQGEPILGCIDQPILDELLIGDNATTTLNGKPVRVRPCDDLSKATFLVTDAERIRRHRQALPGVDALIEATDLKRTWGDCYGYLLLCTGRVDLMVDPEMMPWDLLPLIPCVRGAGGVISDVRGGDFSTGLSAVAAGPGIHAKAIEILNRG